MKLLFDENLSYRLVEIVSELFPGPVHVARVGLNRSAPDRRIWECAEQNGFAIITADSDFITLANTLGHPPKVLLLENCDYPTDVAARVISANAIRISEFEHNDRPLLILRR